MAVVAVCGGCGGFFVIIIPTLVQGPGLRPRLQLGLGCGNSPPPPSHCRWNLKLKLIAIETAIPQPNKFNFKKIAQRQSSRGTHNSGRTISHCSCLLRTMVSNMLNTPGTAGGPGGRDRTLAVKSRKNARKFAFFRKKIKITEKKIFFFAYIF